MSRTDEQIAADAQLTAAVEAVRLAYGDGNEREYILTDFTVVWVDQNIEEQTSRIGGHSRDASLPLYRMIGLLSVALAQLQSQYVD